MREKKFIFLCIVLGSLLFATNDAAGTPPTTTTTTISATETRTIQTLLDRIAQWREDSVVGVGQTSPRWRPFVTVTFAQSIDGKIALFKDEYRNETTANFPISGPESLYMTHGLRSVHDGVLIGGRTLSIDNPRLSNRLWGMNSGNDDDKNTLKQPRPIVLDTHLRHLKQILKNNYGTLNAKNLIVCCSVSVVQEEVEEDLIRMGSVATLLPCQVNGNGEMDLQDVLQKLRTEFQIESIMVEGGSGVISSFVGLGLVDCLCITISPRFFGSRGLSAMDGIVEKEISDTIPEFEQIQTFTLGKDCILLARGPKTEE